MIRRALAALLLIALGAAPALAEETDRLMTLARIWSSVKYLHPLVDAQNIDWDAALVRTIPSVRAAKNDDDVASAITEMLLALHDPATGVIATDDQNSGSPAGQLFHKEGDVLVIDLGPFVARNGDSALGATLAAVFPEVRRATAVVIDMRTRIDMTADVAYAVTEIDGLVRESLTAPPSAGRLHSGYAPQDGGTSGGYYSGFITLPGFTMQGARNGSAPARILFVADAATRLPPIVLAMRDAGVAAVVSDSALSEGNFASTRALPLDAHHVVRLRTSQVLGGDFRADVVDGHPLDAALAIASGKRAMPKRSAPSRVEPPLPQPIRDRPYAEMLYPDLEHRLLAAFRIWSVIDFFYPYKHLIGDWDAVLREFIPRFIAARNDDEYAGAAMEMIAHVEDGHSFVYGHPSIAKLIGAWRAPFVVMRVEGEFAIVRINDEAAKDAGLKLGDVVVSVDGEPMKDRAARLWKYVAASTETARTNRVANLALFGAKDSVATIVLRDASGTRSVRVPRIAFAKPQFGIDSYRLLPGNIGYVNLVRLTVPQVDAMFEALKSTKGIIFDMRGYPNGTAWPIASRINTKNAKIGAIFRRPMFTGNNWNAKTSTGWYFEQELPQDAAHPKYAGKTFMLIDDRAISQSEHTALFFEAANGTTFIGTPTAGANGDVTNYVLPGGLHVNFTGHDVRHADGRQLQRIGIQPHITIAPTLAGLRAGRDEVLERAVEEAGKP